MDIQSLAKCNSQLACPVYLYKFYWFEGKKDHRTPKNLYIVNLAIAGISMCVICIPPTLSQCLYGGEWFLGRFACKLVPTMQGEQVPTMQGRQVYTLQGKQVHTMQSRQV